MPASSLSPEKEHFPRNGHGHGHVHRHSHSHSLSESRRPVPMWDSADPERAPPPLPMHPGTSPKTKPNTSAMIQSTVERLAQKADPTANPYANVTLKPTPTAERNPRGSVGPGASPARGTSPGLHKRIQSLEPLSTKESDPSQKSELSAFLEQHRQRSRSPQKMGSRTSLFDPDLSANLGGRPTKPSGSSTGPINIPETPSAGRPSSRYLSKPILGENTPPSATMLALQNMQIPSEHDATANQANRSPRHNYSPSRYTTNNFELPPSTLGGPNEGLDQLASQLRGLTSIATSLQHELTSLSRRSKDNATDLMSLKDATNARDEDIRKALKDLSVALNMRLKDLEPLRYHLTEGIQHPSKVPHRNASSGSRRDSSPDASEGPRGESASVALLEKVLREMATKEGMENVLKHVEELKRKDAIMDSDRSVLKMLEEILSVVKEPGVYRALSNANPSSRRGASGTGGGAGAAEATAAQAMVKASPGLESLLDQVQQNVLDNGSVTHDVRNIVQEVKDEVTYIGREIGRKIRDKGLRGDSAYRDDDLDDDNEPVNREEIADIVDTGLNGLRRHLEQIIDESHQRSVEGAMLSHEELYDTVCQALDDRGGNSFSPQPAMAELERGMAGGIGKEEILRAVRQGLEMYRPQVEVQTTGLEREEILECLAQGLRSHGDGKEGQNIPNEEQVVAMMQKALADWKPPAFEAAPAQIAASAEEIQAIIRDCLEDNRHGSKDDIATAVDDGLARSELSRKIIDGIKSAIEEKQASEAEKQAAVKDELLTSVRNALAEHREQTQQQMERTGGQGVDHQELTSRIISTIRSTLDGAQLSRRAPLDTANKEDLIPAIKQAFIEANASPREIELNSADIVAAVKEGMDAHNKEQTADMTEQLAVLLDEMKAEFSRGIEKGDTNAKDVLASLEEGMERLTGEVEKVGARAGEVAGKEEMLGMLKGELRMLHADLCRVITETSRAPDTSVETVRLLEAFEKEFDHVKTSLKDMFAAEGGVSADKNEILDAIRDVAESEHLKGPTVKQALEEIKKELEGVKGTVDKDQMVVIMKGVMDELKAKEKEAEEGRMKSLVEQVGRKVEEMKDGMAKDGIDPEAVSGIKAGLEGLRDELAQFTKRFEGFDGARQESSIGKDIEELKSVLGGLQDQLQKTIPATAPEAAKKEELGPVIEALKSVQGSLQAPETVKKAHVDELLQAVNGVQENLKIPDNIATREDMDSLETLLHAMKTRMDELMAPEGTMHGLTVERFNSLAAVTNETKKMIETMQTQAQAQVRPGGDDTEIEKSFAQDEEAEDINGIIKDIWIMVEDLKTGAERAEKNQQDPETRVTKEEVQSLEGLTFDIKALVEGLKIPDPKTLPTKSDLNTFVASFDEFREKVFSEADLTAQAFESRKIEHGGLATKIDETKDLVGESRFELRERMITGQEKLADVKKTIDAMVKGVEKFASAEAVAGLRELVSREFKKASAVDAEASKAANERNEAQLRKLDETREKIFSDLVANLDVRFAEITARHVEHQNYLEGKFDASRKRDVQHVEALTEARAVIENLMGIVRGQGDVLKQTTSGISENADSFYERADKAFTGIGDSMKSQQELVQAEFAKASEATGRLEKQLGNSQPEIIDTLKGLLATVGAEFAASKTTQGEVAQNVKELPETLPKLVVEALPPPPKIELPEPYDDTAVRTKLDSLIGTVRSMPKPEKYDDTCVVAKLESIISHIKSLPEPENYDDTEVNNKLDQVLDYLTSMSEIGTKYDDAPVQGKLDTLLDQATVTGEILLQMDKLDKIQEQVSATQRELTELKTAQAAQIAAEHSNKRKEAEEMAILLERRKAQKEKIEGEILSLHDEKDALLTSVRALRDEKDDLWKTNSKLGRELSGIETALQIRREEMRLMEQRADALERKIVEGSLDHARSLMLATGSNVSRRKSAQSKDGSNAPVSNTVAMALKRRGPAKAGVTANGKEKRILSLNNAGILANRGNERDMSVLGGDVHDSGNKATKSLMLPVSARNFSLDSKSAILSAIQAKANKETSPLNKENKRLPVHEEDEESQLASQDYETPSRTPPVIIKSPEETPRQQQRVSGGKDDMMDVPTVPVNATGHDQYAQDATGYETQSNADTEKHDTSYDSSSTYDSQNYWLSDGPHSFVSTDLTTALGSTVRNQECKPKGGSDISGRSGHRGDRDDDRRHDREDDSMVSGYDASYVTESSVRSDRDVDGSLAESEYDEERGQRREDDETEYGDEYTVDGETDAEGHTDADTTGVSYDDSRYSGADESQLSTHAGDDSAMSHSVVTNGG